MVIKSWDEISDGWYLVRIGRRLVELYYCEGVFNKKDDVSFYFESDVDEIIRKIDKAP